MVRRVAVRIDGRASVRKEWPASGRAGGQTGKRTRGRAGGWAGRRVGGRASGHACGWVQRLRQRQPRCMVIASMRTLNVRTRHIGYQTQCACIASMHTTRVLWLRQHQPWGVVIASIHAQLHTHTPPAVPTTLHIHRPTEPQVWSTASPSPVTLCGHRLDARPMCTTNPSVPATLHNQRSDDHHMCSAASPAPATMIGHRLDAHHHVRTRHI